MSKTKRKTRDRRISKTRRETTTERNYQSKNVIRGIEAENRVLNLFRKSGIKGKRVIQQKETWDGGIPDLEIYYKNRWYDVEVKSVASLIKGENRRYTRGRAQFLRSELVNLKNDNGLIVFEIRDKDRRLRETGNYYYKIAKAEDVYDFVKDEDGEELKLEWSQIHRFPDFEPNNFNIRSIQKLKTKEELLREKIPKLPNKEFYTESDLKTVFSEQEIIDLMRESIITERRPNQFIII